MPPLPVLTTALSFVAALPPSSLPQEVIVVDTAAAKEATDEILRLHSIPAMVSKDMLSVIGGVDGGPEMPSEPAPEGEGAAAAAEAAEAAAPEAAAAVAAQREQPAAAEAAAPAGP